MAAHIGTCTDVRSQHFGHFGPFRQSTLPQICLLDTVEIQLPIAHFSTICPSGYLTGSISMRLGLGQARDMQRNASFHRNAMKTD